MPSARLVATSWESIQRSCHHPEHQNALELPPRCARIDHRADMVPADQRDPLADSWRRVPRSPNAHTIRQMRDDRGAFRRVRPRNA